MIVLTTTVPRMMQAPMGASQLNTSDQTVGDVFLSSQTTFLVLEERYKQIATQTAVKAMGVRTHRIFTA